MKIRTFGHNGTMSSEVTGLEIRNRAVARKAAAEGFVLLKNDGILPLKKGTAVGLFGIGAVNMVKGGTGSGDVNARCVVSIEQGMQDAGYSITDSSYLEDCKKLYLDARRAWRDFIRKDPGPEDPGYGESLFDRYTQHPFLYPEGREIIAEDLIPDAESAPGGEVQNAVPAVYVISRVAGEGADRTLEEGDYYLTRGEKRDLQALKNLGARIIVLINTGGAIDMTEILENPAVSAILLISQPGQEGGHAVCRVEMASGRRSSILPGTIRKTTV